MMARDLKQLGYVFQHSKVDSQNYLLLQRRNRVYGLGDLDCGQSSGDLAKRLLTTMLDLASESNSFAFDDVFDSSLPKCALRGNALDKVNQAVERSLIDNKSQNLFVDTSTSADRDAEVAVGVCTCIRPSHPIYSVKLGRYVTVGELFNCQGLWKEDFRRPEAIDRLLQLPAKAQDLCGNAFSSTVSQAFLLASLVHGQGWKNIDLKSTEQADLEAAYNTAGPSSASDLEADTPPSDHESFATPRPTTTKRAISAYWKPTSPQKRARFVSAPAASMSHEAQFGEKNANVQKALFHCTVHKCTQAVTALLQ